MEESKYIVIYVPVLALEADLLNREENAQLHDVACKAIDRTRSSILSQLEPNDKLFVIPVKRNENPRMEMLYPMDPAKRELMEARYVTFEKELLIWLTTQEILSSPIPKHESVESEYKVAIAKPKFLSRKWFASKLSWNRVPSVK